MSLLPNLFKHTDIPTTFGRKVEKPVEKKPDPIAAFESGDHSLLLGDGGEFTAVEMFSPAEDIDYEACARAMNEAMPYVSVKEKIALYRASSDPKLRLLADAWAEATEIVAPRKKPAPYQPKSDLPTQATMDAYTVAWQAAGKPDMSGVYRDLGFSQMDIMRDQDIRKVVSYLESFYFTFGRYWKLRDVLGLACKDAGVEHDIPSLRLMVGLGESKSSSLPELKRMIDHVNSLPRAPF